MSRLTYLDSAKNTLEVIYILLGEHPAVYPNRHGHRRPRFFDSAFDPRLRLSFDLASAFLQRLLPVLIEFEFPRLKRVDLTGFRILKTDRSGLTSPPDSPVTWELLDRCPFVNRTIAETENIDYYQTWTGYDALHIVYEEQELMEATEILRRSLRAQ